MFATVINQVSAGDISPDHAGTVFASVIRNLHPTYFFGRNAARLEQFSAELALRHVHGDITAADTGKILTTLANAAASRDTRVCREIMQASGRSRNP